MMKIINGLLVLGVVAAAIAFVHFEFIKPAIEENKLLEAQLQETHEIEGQVHPSLPLRSLGQIATMPDEVMSQRIKDMVTGQTGYIEADALMVDEHLRCWLDPQYQVVAGGVDEWTLEATRVMNGFEIVIPQNVRYRWVREPHISSVYLPVVRVTIER